MPMSCKCPAYNADVMRWQSNTSFTRTEGHARSFSNFRRRRAAGLDRSAHVPARRTAAFGPLRSRRPVRSAHLEDSELWLGIAIQRTPK